MLELVGDRPDVAGGPILMRGDNMAAESWVSRSGAATDKRACLLMRMPGRFELAGGWDHTAKHVLGVQNTLADRISRWPREMLADKVMELTHSTDWRERSIGPRGSGFLCCTLDKEHLRKTRRRFMDAHDEQSRRTRLTRAPVTMHALLNSWHAYWACTVSQEQGTTKEETRKRWQDWSERTHLVRGGKISETLFSKMKHLDKREKSVGERVLVAYCRRSQ